jgi:hypothetical protein
MKQQLVVCGNKKIRDRTHRVNPIRHEPGCCTSRHNADALPAAERVRAEEMRMMAMKRMRMTEEVGEWMIRMQ